MDQYHLSLQQGVTSFYEYPHFLQLFYNTNKQKFSFHLHIFIQKHAPMNGRSYLYLFVNLLNLN